MVAAISEAVDGAWVAVQVRQRMEQSVSRSLHVRGYTGFLPECVRRGRAALAQRTVLFPGYVFCRFIQNPTFRIVEIPGVIRLVGFNNKVAAIPDAEIDAIRKIIASNAQAKVVPLLQAGETVEVVDGPLMGVTGSVLRLKSRNWIVISVPLLKRSVTVEVNARDIRVVDDETKMSDGSRRILRPADLIAPKHLTEVAAVP